MIQISVYPDGLVVRTPSSTYDVSFSSAKSLVSKYLSLGYVVKSMDFDRVGREIGVMIYLEKPKKAVKNSYPYWLRKKRV